MRRAPWCRAAPLKSTIANTGTTAAQRLVDIGKAKDVAWCVARHLFSRIAAISYVFLFALHARVMSSCDCRVYADVWCCAERRASSGITSPCYKWLRSVCVYVCTCMSTATNLAAFDADLPTETAFNSPISPATETRTLTNATTFSRLDVALRSARATAPLPL